MPGTYTYNSKLTTAVVRYNLPTSRNRKTPKSNNQIIGYRGPGLARNINLASCLT